MKQINNGFREYYYLTKDGKVYNKYKERYLKPDKNRYRMYMIDGKYKSVSIKELYRLVYDDIYCVDVIEDLQGEEWKVIHNTDNKYFVSNMGRVKSLCGYESQILQPIDRQGYERVCIKVNGIKSHKSIHKLVALYFLPNDNVAAIQLHHKDGNKKNNCVNNLMWVTPQEHKAIHKKLKEQEQGNNERT